MLYQSVGSSSCAICAVGNLLSLYGIDLRRRDISDLFRRSIDRSLPNINHPMLLRVVSQFFPRRTLLWRTFPAFCFDRVAHALELARSVGGPLLLTFHMRHSVRDWAGVHCVVVVGIDPAGIHVIDSLGRRNGKWPNSTIISDEAAFGWHVSGAPLVVIRRPARILVGLPAIETRGNDLK